MRVLSGGKATLFGITGLLMTFLLPGTALAQGADDDIYGQPYDNQIALQKGVTDIARRIEAFDNGLIALAFVVSLLVMTLLLIACFRFSAKRNPTPSKTSHNTLLEVLWTLIPVTILAVVAVPSVDCCSPRTISRQGI